MKIKEENLYKLAEEIKEYKDAGAEFYMYSGNNYMYKEKYCGFFEIRKNGKTIIVYALCMEPIVRIRDIKKISTTTLHLLKSTGTIHYAKTNDIARFKNLSDFYYSCIVDFLKHTLCTQK